MAEEVVGAEQAKDTLLDKAKAILCKVTWKHALVIAIPLILYIYPRPILKLFVPIASKINKNHPTVACDDFIR
jgi:hypothetical protein